MFTPSDRTRKKHKTKVDELIAPDRSIEIAYGNRALEMNAQAWGVIGFVVVAFLVGLAFGTILIPGVIFLVVFMNVARPPRIIAVTPAQILVVSRSGLTSNPKEVVAAQPVFPVMPGVTELQLGDEPLKFKASEGHRIGNASVSGVPVAQPDPYVTPGPMAPVQSIPPTYE